MKHRRELQLTSMAPSTLRIRTVQWNCYRQFCLDHHLASIPCTDDQLSLYASYLSKLLTYFSVCNYLHAVIFYHKLTGYAPPSVSSVSVKLTLLGIKRKPHVVHQARLPITLAHLKKIYIHLDLSRSTHIMWWACLLILFRSLLRVSHVTESPHNLLVQDVKFIDAGLILIIHTSKTAQVSSQPRYIPIAHLQDKSMCAVFWLKRWLSLSQAPPSAPLFSLNRRALTYRAFQAALAASVKKAGLKGKISSHSFRRGGATFLSAIGMPIEKIKERGGWKSDTALTYIAEPIQVKMRREGVVSNVINELLIN